LPEGATFAQMVAPFAAHLGEVYFAWPGAASGRAPAGAQRGYVDWTVQARLEEDLVALRALGLSLDLLFNANCYGRLAVSQHLERQVGSVLDHLGELLGGVQTVTTTSLAVARTVKHYYPSVEVRASVNMRIGTIKAMSAVAGLFDGYYVQREHNRDLAYLAELKAWADSAGKRLCLLANSGCLAWCPGQSFHDNLVAHEAEIDETQNIPEWTPHVCWNLLADRAQWPAVLQNTWIRPEDLDHYEGLFGLVKLATRQHARPTAVIRAYVERRWRGNLLDLFEPGYGPAFAPYVLDNSRFPADWFATTSSCDRRCHTCDYCARVLEQILLKAE
jgi:hypothetical protein